MKHLHTAGIFVMTCLSICLLSCKKETTSKDFRDKYVGEYQVKEILDSYGFPECGESYSEKDTIIIVDYGHSDTTLLVLGREVFLDSVGYYTTYHYSLMLRNDSIRSFYMNGGLGCGIYEIYEGNKINSNL